MLKESLRLIMNTINTPDLPLENLREARIVISDEHTLSKKHDRISRIIRYSYILLSAVFGLSSGAFSYGYFNNSYSKLEAYLAVIALVSLGILVLLLMYDGKFSKEETAPTQKLLLYGSVIDARIFEKEFKELDVDQRTLRHLAELQSYIRQYNEINKSELKKYYWLGVSAMLFGTLVITSTIIIGVVNNQVVSVISGFVSGVLIDYIGVIFVKMYTGMIESISKFQKTLFEDSGIYLANVLTSQIGDETLKNQTISDIAKSLVPKRSA